MTLALGGGMSVYYLSKTNAKMQKSTTASALVVSWGIPASPQTCPYAGACARGCYAKYGRYLFPNVKTKMGARLTLAESEEFVDTIDREVKELTAKNPEKSLFVRIHDSGDFYTPEYTRKWFEVMRRNPSVHFYAYTKAITMFEALRESGEIPENFNLIYSYGGTQDHLIDPSKHAHARVFETVEELERAGYLDCSADDLLALTTDRVGLVYHGARKWENSGFDEVA